MVCVAVAAGGGAGVCCNKCRGNPIGMEVMAAESDFNMLDRAFFTFTLSVEDGKGSLGETAGSGVSAVCRTDITLLVLFGLEPQPAGSGESCGWGVDG